MTLSDLQTDLYDRLGLKGTQADDIRRILGFINVSQREILGRKGIGSRLRRGTLIFSTPASAASSTYRNPFVGLPQACSHVFSITNRLSGIPLDEIPMPTAVWNDPAVSSSSTDPYQYAIYSYNAPVFYQPLPASPLSTYGVRVSAVSDAAGDTQTLTVEGIASSGALRKQTAVLTGLTPKNLGAVNDYALITKLYLSSAAVGNITVTLTDDTGGYDAAVIGIGQTKAKYTVLYLQPVPSAVFQLAADVELAISDLADPNEESIIPEDFHWLLECGALKKEYAKREKLGQYKLEHDRWRDGVAELRDFLHRRGGIPASSKTPRRFSQLGAFYPAGS